MRPRPREGPPPERLCEHIFAKEPRSTWHIDNPLGGAMFFCTAAIGIGEVGCIVTSGGVIAQESGSVPARSVAGQSGSGGRLDAPDARRLDRVFSLFLQTSVQGDSTMSADWSTMKFEEPSMHYEFITTIATILLVGATIAGFVLSAARSVTRAAEQRFALFEERFQKIDARFEKVDERFEKVDERFEKVDERFEKVDERFAKIDERFFEIQKEFTAVHKEFAAVHAGIARLEGLIEGLRQTPAFASAPQSASQA